MKTLLRLTALCLLLCALPCAAPADVSLRGYDSEAGYQYVALGSFPQTAEGENAPILWRVLDAGDREAYLLSEYILFNNRIHPDDNAYIAFGGAFNRTEMFALLNGPFERIVISEDEAARLRKKSYYGRAYDAEMSFKEQAFTARELSLLQTDEELGTVFLPTADDLLNKAYGLGDKRAMQAYGTPFALATGLFRYSNGSSPYWTRSQSLSYSYATRCTKEAGNLGYIRCVVMNEGCRPAVRLRTEGLEPIGGDGSFENPYTFHR